MPSRPRWRARTSEQSINQSRPGRGRAERNNRWWHSGMHGRLDIGHADTSIIVYIMRDMMRDSWACEGMVYAIRDAYQRRALIILLHETKSTDEDPATTPPHLDPTRVFGLRARPWTMRVGDDARRRRTTDDGRRATRHSSTRVASVEARHPRESCLHSPCPPWRRRCRRRRPRA